MRKVRESGRTYLDFVGYISIVFALMIIPLAYVLPKTISWENGFLENLQVVVLLVGCLLAFTFFQKTYTCKVHYMWLTISGAFLLLMGRELSWGRVFFQTGMTEDGPKFIPMSQVPHHGLINILLGIFLVAILIGLLKTVPWHAIFFDVPMLKTGVSLIVVGVIFSLIGEHGWIFAGYRGETVEELGELLFYSWAIILTAYYYHYLNTTKS